MKERPSLSMARQSVEHLIAQVGKDASPTVIEAAKHAATVIGWLERHQELMRAVDELHRRAPYLAQMFREFPGAKIENVRSYDDDYFDTLG